MAGNPYSPPNLTSPLRSSVLHNLVVMFNYSIHFEFQINQIIIKSSFSLLCNIVSLQPSLNLKDAVTVVIEFIVSWIIVTSCIMACLIKSRILLKFGRNYTGSFSFETHDCLVHSCLSKLILTNVPSRTLRSRSESLLVPKFWLTSVGGSFVFEEFRCKSR